jgi:hypothetical protein
MPILPAGDLRARAIAANQRVVNDNVAAAEEVLSLQIDRAIAAGHLKVTLQHNLEDLSPAPDIREAQIAGIAHKLVSQLKSLGYVLQDLEPRADQPPRYYRMVRRQIQLEASFENA